ncbi:hypothetical protein [Microvirga lotononidis]|uniref:hypothetical protein n=1 Tax=Microvirga lotononidis TaxID=864069 RepID=UPI000A4D0B64|nr:hypothetical protein [Microvirga lotononidis]WQO29411.1 hypothetical protein U0023_10235 [Microvirga lotononidis]
MASSDRKTSRRANSPEHLKADQAARFVAAAKAAGCDETGEAFEKAFGKVVPPKRPDKREKGDKPETKKPGQ